MRWRYAFLISLMVLCGRVAIGQILVEGTELSFNLPNERWNLADEQSEGRLTVKYYKREALIDSAGRSVIANIAVITEPNP